ncbi:hypothetical protein [Methylomonas albis]|uniref:Uncharacterized protein n=1 Tax=Methylomonas albis TaxID=1854563 RepID=A0ABR9D4Z4_9GAMM|nr:hypothetical protein [Methylomonas albis]MBD9358000.1 hypothetical protein [Methylomonas albis]
MNGNNNLRRYPRGRPKLEKLWTAIVNTLIYYNADSAKINFPIAVAIRTSSRAAFIRHMALVIVEKDLAVQ